MTSAISDTYLETEGSVSPIQFATTLPSACLFLSSRSQGEGSHIHRINSQPWWGVSGSRGRGGKKNEKKSHQACPLPVGLE